MSPARTRAAVADLERQFPMTRRRLGREKFNLLRPALAQAMTAFGPTDVQHREALQRRRNAARIHRSHAKRLSAVARQLDSVLNATRALIDEALELEYLPERGLDVSLPSVELTTAPPHQAFSRLRLAATLLGLYAERWAEGAQFDLSGPRGRQLGVRLYLGQWLATRLRKVGGRLTKSRNGLLAILLTEAYDAVGIPVPLDLDREVTRVIDALPKRPAN
jgi:hypothetical protein